MKIVFHKIQTANTITQEKIPMHIQDRKLIKNCMHLHLIRSDLLSSWYIVRFSKNILEDISVSYSTYIRGFKILFFSLFFFLTTTASILNCLMYFLLSAAIYMIQNSRHIDRIPAVYLITEYVLSRMIVIFVTSILW